MTLKDKKTSRINYLDMTPVRLINDYSVENGQVVLRIPKFKKAWMRKWLIPDSKSSHFRIHLDANGSRIWQLINGNRNTNDICEQMSAIMNNENYRSEDLDTRITKYLSELYKNRFITFRELTR